MTPPTPRQYEIYHGSTFRYQKPARGSVMLLHFCPRSSLHQRTLSFHLAIDPVAVPVALSDPFGNACHLFNIHREHLHTKVESRLRVEIENLPPLPDRLPTGAWDKITEMARAPYNWGYLRPTPLTRDSDALSAFIKEIGIGRGDDPLVTLRETSEALYQAFTYLPGSTEVDSPSEQILKTREGVCQDYTHVLLAILRRWGIPGRYVSGYLYLENVAREQSSPYASHAWAEFLFPELGWVGIDPTNDSLADIRHIQIAIGRDYTDVAPTRGAVHGGGEIDLEVEVSTSLAHEPLPVAIARQEHANIRNLETAIQIQTHSDQ